MATLSVGGTTVFDGATLQSGVTFPAGHVRQIKYGDLGVVASGDSDVYYPNSIQFDNAILSTSDVWLCAAGTGTSRTGHSDNFIDLYFSSADGGSLGEGSSGHKFMLYLNYGTAANNMRYGWSGQYLVTNPNSTTPTYKVFVIRDAEDNGYNTQLEAGASMTLMEISSS